MIQKKRPNPTQFALWASGGGPMLVFATYASLSPQGLIDDQDNEEDSADLARSGTPEWCKSSQSQLASARDN